MRRASYMCMKKKLTDDRTHIYQLLQTTWSLYAQVDTGLRLFEGDADLLVLEGDADLLVLEGDADLLVPEDDADLNLPEGAVGLLVLEGDADLRVPEGYRNLIRLEETTHTHCTSMTRGSAAFVGVAVLCYTEGVCVITSTGGPH